jgi:hypothetical protein
MDGREETVESLDSGAQRWRQIIATVFGAALCALILALMIL